MSEEIGFEVVKGNVQASMKRVVALWYADVDRISLDGVSQFTGAAVFYSIFDMGGVVQYYVSLYEMNGNLFVTWRYKPGNVKVSKCNEVEEEIMKALRGNGIMFQPVLQSTATYRSILKKLPLVMAIDDKTPCVGEFQFDQKKETGGVVLSATDRDTLKHAVALF